jgi:hypothetical protein
VAHRLLQAGSKEIAGRADILEAAFWLFRRAGWTDEALDCLDKMEGAGRWTGYRLEQFVKQ